VVISVGLAGCATDQVTQKKIEDSKVALERNEFDTALAKADSAIAGAGNQADRATAYYLHGRAIEQRVKADPAAAQNDLSLARADYTRALYLAPPKKLEGYIRTSLANVDFFQDDFAGAFEQWSRAYNLLTEPDLKAWTLYRLALCQQRLGQFAQADNTFGQVLSLFPGTEQAKLSRERQGARNFMVQLATFTNSKSADAAVAALRKQGLTPTRTTDARGLSIIRVGPVATYREALSLKQRFAATYSDAIILP
jgi:tetratricopeptide (TPR) repeat protein